MKLRTLKWAGLVVTGGVLFQAASCATLIAETVISNLIPLLIAQLLSGPTP